MNEQLAGTCANWSCSFLEPIDLVASQRAAGAPPALQLHARRAQPAERCIYANMIVMLHARRLHTNLGLGRARHSRAPALRALPKDPMYPLHTGQYPVFVYFGLAWLRGPYLHGASRASRSIGDRAVRASDAYSVRKELSQGAPWTTRGAHSIFFRARSSHTPSRALWSSLELFGALWSDFKLFTGSPSAIRWVTDVFGSPPRFWDVGRVLYTVLGSQTAGSGEAGGARQRSALRDAYPLWRTRVSWAESDGVTHIPRGSHLGVLAKTRPRQGAESDEVARSKGLTPRCARQDSPPTPQRPDPRRRAWHGVHP